jgi:hypothetical protein
MIYDGLPACCLVILLLIGFTGFSLRRSAASPQTTLEWITLLKSQYAAIETTKCQC